MIELPVRNHVFWKKFFDDNNTLVYKYIVKEIEKSIRADHSSTRLFKFVETGDIKTISRKNYTRVLQEALTAFVAHEEYELAHKAREVLDSHLVEQFLRETVGE